MKFFWVLLLVAAPFAVADDSDSDDASPDSSSSAVQGRTGSSGGFTPAAAPAPAPAAAAPAGGAQGNTRFLGLGNLLGAGQALLGGALGAIGNPGFGVGFQQGFGGFGGFGGGFQPGFGVGCRYSCRAPNGQFVCCGNSGFGTKPGQCPPIRPVCPDVRNFAPPQPCIIDHECTGLDKCCFDTCLEERVCKPPHGIGGFGR
ncbi:pupal cuticle protein 36-like [Macrobrachium nipponense]|uniref:pupal cuticle protein 36-like n=1 Tax=Macrobrachium nipponense TaxID=159736 RepID=UPI0030C7A2E2